MFNIRKIAFTGFVVASLAFAAQVARADGHEQARQLLQPSESRTTVKAFGPTSAMVALDGHEQARRMIEGSIVEAQQENVRYAHAVLVAEPESFADGQAQARHLLDRNLVTRRQEASTSRTSAVAVKSRQGPSR
jgi:FtsZ-interacting cell division protein YlmF